MSDLSNVLPNDSGLVLHFGPGRMPDHRRAGVRRLVDLVADEFVPSQRDGALADGPTAMCAAGVLEQSNLIVARDAQVVALLSYRTAPTDARFPPSDRAAVHLSRVATCPGERRRGLARALHETFIDLVAPAGEVVTVSTWSSNTGYLALLDSLGFIVGSVTPGTRSGGECLIHLEFDTWRSSSWRDA